MEINLFDIPHIGFAPILYMKIVADGIEFYKKGLGATQLRRIDNPDGSAHVAELLIGTSIVRLHEETSRNAEYGPSKLGGTSVVLGLFVDSPDEIIEKAVAAGATLLDPAQDFDYGYRQGKIKDPFGHIWQLEKLIPMT